MKKRLDEQLSAQSALLIMVSAVLLILMSAAVAKACSPSSAPGCDIGCAVQVVNNCKYAGFDCVARSCQYDTCSSCPGRECGRTCGQVFNAPCLACVSHSLGGCRGMPECCVPR